MKRLLCLFICLSCYYSIAMAECGTREDALVLLQCNSPYKHTISYQAMDAWENGTADAVKLMDVTREERKVGVNKWSAAVQMFQKLYCPDHPFFMDTVDGRYLLDVFMMEGGLLPHVYHLLPNAEEISRDTAWHLAEEALRMQFQLAFEGTFRNVWVDTHYFSPTGEKQDAFWLFHVKMENGTKYAVQVRAGEVSVCHRLEEEEALFEAYTKLCDEKGAFYTWTPDDKWHYASRLPEEILAAYIEGQDLSCCADLLAIARQGFALPTDDVPAYAEMLEKAEEAVEKALCLPEDWAAKAVIQDSFFCTEERLTWRVIFIKTGMKECPGAVVEMDAFTGEVFRLERYDGTPESIPYVERL